MFDGLKRLMPTADRPGSSPDNPLRCSMGRPDFVTDRKPFGDAYGAMISRYGSDMLPEADTREIYKDAPPELIAKVSPEKLRRLAFTAMGLVDENADLNPCFRDASTRELVLRQIALNQLSQAVRHQQETGQAD